jgi:hypothetical protein
VEEVQQSPRARTEPPFADLRLHGRSGVDEHLGAITARKPAFAVRITGITESTRRHREQAAVLVGGLLRQQRRVFGQQSLQATRSLSWMTLGRQLLPAGETVFARDDELRVALRQRRLDVCRETGEPGEISERSCQPPFMTRLYPLRPG